MVNKKTTSTAQPTTLNPDMQAEILRMMQAEGVELDAEALRVLNQIAGKEFEETYKRLAAEKAKEGVEEEEQQNEKTTNDENMEQK